MDKLKIGIAGASGFVGRYLIDALLKAGHSVVALSRRDRSKENNDNLKWVTCDLFSRRDARVGLEGCDIAFYLTHSMIPSARLSQGNFADYDLVLADNFARSARSNQLKQIIYLGGIVPEDYSLSRHLLSRLEVERTLKASKVPLTSLRAGIILGPEGSSFRIMYNLVKNLPVMVCPSWTGTLSNPVSIWDMTSYLVHCVGNEKLYNKFFDIGGKTTLSYIEMMRVLSQKLNKKRLLLMVPFFSPNLSRLWVTKFSGAPKDLVYPLIGSLKTHMVPNVNHSLGKVCESGMSYEDAIDRILKESGNLEKTPSAFKYSGAVNDKSVRSIQRLETLYRFNAWEVSEIYFNWLHSNFPIIAIRRTSDRINICLSGFSTPLISLQKNTEVSSEDYCLFYIKEGFLSTGEGRGRLIFRTIIDGRNTMVEIHEFFPRLPWFVYKFTQAIFHLITMKMFNRFLLRLQKNIGTEVRSTLLSG
ncbi:MAG: NAD(P)H-binding protein [Oligoflexales bacterium]|nr:NAD(P)H-binding protein [Oligoflexales bacterium]